MPSEDDGTQRDPGRIAQAVLSIWDAIDGRAKDLARQKAGHPVGSWSALHFFCFLLGLIMMPCLAAGGNVVVRVPLADALRVLDALSEHLPLILGGMLIVLCGLSAIFSHGCGGRYTYQCSFWRGFRTGGFFTVMTVLSVGGPALLSWT